MLEIASAKFHNLIRNAFEKSCPLRQRKSTNKVPWWNKNLEKLLSISRRLFNRTKKTRCDCDWERYKEALSLRRSKRELWRDFCEGINELPAAARLQKLLAKDPTNQIS